MGRRNKERRAAKARAKQRHRRGASAPGGFADGQWFSSAQAIELTLMSAAHAVASGEPQVARDCSTELTGADSPIEPRLLGRVAIGYLSDTFAHLWRCGWQPADLAALIRRRRTDKHLSVTVAVIEDEARRYAAHTVHPRWHAQLMDLGADPWPADARTGPQAAGRSKLELGTQAGLQVAIEVIAVLMTVPELRVLMAPPGSYRAGGGEGAGIDERALARIRALLAKAESSEFPDEAEALSAKAQELMARHAVSRIVIESQAPSEQPVLGRRVWLDAPYADAKSLLIAAVSAANRCRSVWSGDLGFATVLGERPDLDAVELVSTSLLVQANRAMVGHGQQRNRYGESRTRSFRQSFLVAYASRIGERLRGATDAVVHEAADGDARLLPVLRAQSRRVDEAMAEMFPETVRRGVSATSGAGWAAGRAAADQALFDVADALPGAADRSAARAAS